VPPAPEVPPLQPLLELAALPFCPSLASLPPQLLRVSAEPDIKLAMHRPANIFLISSVCMSAPNRLSFLNVLSDERQSVKPTGNTSISGTGLFAKPWFIKCANFTAYLE